MRIVGAVEMMCFIVRYADSISCEVLRCKVDEPQYLVLPDVQVCKEQRSAEDKEEETQR